MPGALHNLGRNEEAYPAPHPRTGGITIDDVREGEDALSSLWLK